MKAVMISIQPKWCEKIASGEKTVEVRKTRPKTETPFPCFIYETKTPLRWNKAHNNIIGGEGGYVIGEFVCDEVFPIRVFENGSIQDYVCHGMERSCVPYEDIADYIGKDKTGYGWHISDLVIYDTPKELSEFFKACDKPPLTDCSKCIDQMKVACKPLSRPPQSWCYVEVQE